MDGKKISEGEANLIHSASLTPEERFKYRMARPKAKSPQNVLRELPQDREGRKVMPIATGVIDYFPLALAEIAKVSKAGND